MNFRIWVSFFVVWSGILFSQQAEERQVFVKGNALLLPVGIINAAAEFQLAPKITLQGDATLSPWKSFAGHNARFLIAGVDGRYYFKEAFSGWYVGANVSGATFNISKWNYWNNEFYKNKQGEITPYINSNLYQKGYSFIIGAVGGYQFSWKERWNLDVFLAFGNAQDRYKGYDKLSGDRYDTDHGDGWNRSGEWLPYRGGIMVSYKIK